MFHKSGKKEGKFLTKIGFMSNKLQLLTNSVMICSANVLYSKSEENLFT